MARAKAATYLSKEIKIMNALQSLKIAINNSVKELTQLESNARDNDENYEQTLNRLHAEGFLDGLQWALNLVERANLTENKGE